MANTVEIMELYTAYFNRAADKAGVDYWANEMDANGWTLDQVAQSFADQPEYQAIYGNLTNEGTIVEIYKNLLNRKPDAAGLAYWEEQLDSGAIQISNMVQAIINGAKGSDIAIIDNKTAVSQYAYDAGLEATDAKTISLENITADPSTIASAEAAIDAINPANVGETFTLTTGVDTFTGTAKNDTFNASVLTANDNDTLDGGAGHDVLTIETAANTTDKFKATSIETVNYTALGNLSVDMKNIADATTFNNNNSTGTVTLNNIAKADMVVGVKGSTTNNIDLNYATGVLNGSADKLTVNLNGSTATTVTADSGFESVEVKTTSASTLNTLTAANATALTLSGSADLTLGDGAVNTFSDYTVTNSGKVTYNDITSVKTFNAASNTGGIVGKDLNATTTLDNGTSKDVLTMSTTGSLVQTGSGNDNISVNSAALLSTSNAIIKLGAGNDVLSVKPGNSGEYIYAEDGDDTIYVDGNLGSTDLIDGGAGTDTVNFVAKTTSNFIAKGIEKIGVQGATTDTNTVSFVSIDSAVAITDSGAGASVFSGLKNGSTYTSTVKKEAAGDDVTLNFASGEKATVVVDLTKGVKNSSVTTTNAENVNVKYGAASDTTTDTISVNGAKSLTVNTTGAFTTSATAMTVSATAVAQEMLETITITGDKEITFGDITNDAKLTSVTASSTGGAVTLGAVGEAANTTADVTVTKISATSTAGKAVIGNIDFSGVATTVTGNIAEITATGAAGTAAATTIGTIDADKLGTVTATSSNHNATIDKITAGADTAADTTDGTVTALKASGFLAATIGDIRADNVGSIVVESTDTVTGGAASVGDIDSGSIAQGTTALAAVQNKATIGTIDVSSKKAAASVGAIDATQLGNVTITGGTTATLGAINVSNTAKDSVTGNITVNAGTDKALLGAITADKVGTITAKSTSGIVEVGNMSFLDTAGATISLTAGTSIANTTAGGDTIKNEKGDLTFTAKAETTFIGTNKLTISAGKAGEVSSDIDVSVDLSAVKGAVGHTNATNVIIVNEGNDSASSTVVKGGLAANNLTITGATEASTQTITYYGQNKVDTIVLSGKYASSTIYTELDNDVVTLGAGKDSIISKGNVSVTLDATTVNANSLDSWTGYQANDANSVLITGGTAAVWDDAVTGWTITNGIATKANATVADFYTDFAAVAGTAAEVAAFVHGGNTYVFGEGAANNNTDDVAIVLLGVELTSVSAAHGAGVLHIG